MHQLKPSLSNNIYPNGKSSIHTIDVQTLQQIYEVFRTYSCAMLH